MNDSIDIKYTHASTFIIYFSKTEGRPTDRYIYFHIYDLFNYNKVVLTIMACVCR